MSTVDKNIVNIKSCILSLLPNAKIKLFGSRAKGIDVPTSDYDILIISPSYLNLSQINEYKAVLRKKLAQFFIPIDIVMVNESDILSKSQLTNHIVNEALLHGIEL